MTTRPAAAIAPTAAAAAVGVGTYALVKLAFEWLTQDGSASPMWWPMAAAVVAVLVRCPKRWWWGLIGGFCLGLAAATAVEMGWVLALAYLLANAVEIAVASLILTDRWNHRDRRMPVARDALRFTLATLAAVAAGTVVILLSAVFRTGDAASLGILGVYATNHLLGYLTVAPLLLPNKHVQKWVLRSGLEFVAVLVAVCALAVWSLMQQNSDGRAFVMLAPVMWSAVRFGSSRATAVSALTCALVAFATADGRGPLASSADLMQRQFLTEVFILVVTASTLGLVLVTRHRIQLATAARNSEQTLRVAIRDALIGMYSIRLDGKHLGEIRDANTALADLLGYRPEQLIGRHCSILGAHGEPEAERILQCHLDNFVNGSLTSLREESTFRTADGASRWVELNLSAVDSVGEDRYILVHVHDLTDRENAKQSLERMALHDALTGLANRTLLFRHVNSAMADARHSDRVVGMLYLDLDGFKTINDTYGHDAGDAVLVAVARRLTGAVRRDATVARLGGDEFAILCPIDESADELVVVAERIRRLLREPIHVTAGSADERDAGIDVTIDVSIGIGTAIGTDSADDLIRAADQAMYAVKQSRRVPRA